MKLSNLPNPEHYQRSTGNIEHEGATVVATMCMHGLGCALPGGVIVGNEEDAKRAARIMAADMRRSHVR